jgi:hypothetical protein
MIFKGKQILSATKRRGWIYAKEGGGGKGGGNSTVMARKTKLTFLIFVFRDDNKPYEVGHMPSLL